VSALLDFAAETDRQLNPYLAHYLPEAISGVDAWESLSEDIGLLDQLDPASLAAVLARDLFGTARMTPPLEAALLSRGARTQPGSLAKVLNRRRVGAQRGLKQVQLLWTKLRRVTPNVPFVAHSGTIRSIALGMLDDRRLALVSVGGDDTIRLWDPASGTALREPIPVVGARFTAVAISQIPTGTVIATTSEDCTIRLWDADSGEPLSPPFTRHSRPLTGVAFGVVDGNSLIATSSQDGTARLWDLDHSPVGPPLRGHEGGLTGVAFAVLEGQSLLATIGSDGTARLWNPLTADLVAPPLTGHSAGLTALAFGEIDGRLKLATASADLTARIWDLHAFAPAGPPLRGHSMPLTGIAFGRSGRGESYLITTSHDGTARLWSTQSNRSKGRQRLSGHERGLTGVVTAELQDGRHLFITSGHDGTIRMWDPASARGSHKARGHRCSITSLAEGVVLDHAVIVAGCQHGIQCWNAESGSEGRRIRTSSWVTSVAFQPGSETSRFACGGKDGTVKVWDSLTEAQPKITIKAHPRAITELAWLEYGGLELLATGSYDGTARVWDPVTGEPITGRLRGHGNAVLTVALGVIQGSPVLASGSADRTLRLWNPQTGASIGELANDSAVSSVSFVIFEDDELLVTGSVDGAVRQWDPTRYAGPTLITRSSSPIVSVVPTALHGGNALVVLNRDGDCTLWSREFPGRWAEESLFRLSIQANVAIASERAIYIGTRAGLIACLNDSDR
jgi:WD40 repeat protein